MADRPYGVVLGPEIGEAMETAAAAVDIDTTAFVRAVLAGALRRGSVTDLALQAIEKGLVPPPKRRPRESKPWESDGENWHLGPWTMTRKGQPSRYPNPGDGWYLTGPGIEGEHYLNETSQKAAVLAANDYIAVREGGA